MKKLLAMALVLCMLIGTFAVASAEEVTTLTMWTFIAQHQEFFEKAADRWNGDHPDRPIAVEVTTIGYDDMHNKLKVALQADEGAPDMCDVELGQFPNIPFGTYKVLFHGQDVNTVEHVSVPLAFKEDFTVEGELEGSFSNDGAGAMNLTLNGVEYHGFCLPGYDADQDEYVSTFTAMSGDGQTVWGVRATGQD